MDTKDKFLIACSVIIYAVLFFSFEGNNHDLDMFLGSNIGFVVAVAIIFCMVSIIYFLISPLLKRVLNWFLTSPDDSFFISHTDDKSK